MADNYMEHPELDGSSFHFQGGKTGFLLLHGFTATTAEVRPWASVYMLPATP